MYLFIGFILCSTNFGQYSNYGTASQAEHIYAKNENHADQESGKEGRVNCLPPKCWKPGDWWIVQTNLITLDNTMNSEDGKKKATSPGEPEHFSVSSYFYLFQAITKKTINGKSCWVVDIKPFDIPSEIKNDHKNNYLWRVYLDPNNLTVRRVLVNTRGGPYLVSGAGIKKRIVDYKQGNPALAEGFSKNVPFDFPKLPFQEFQDYLPEEKDLIKYHDEHCIDASVQLNLLLRVKDTRLLYIKWLNKSKGEVRMQKWMPGLPWWAEWQRTTTKPFAPGLLNAKLISWGDAKTPPSK